MSLIRPGEAGAQADMEAIMEEEMAAVEAQPVTLFRGTRLINLHSVETMPARHLDFRISHRFGPLNGGAHEFFGLDNAQYRLGLEYGVTDRLMVGVGRSQYQKAYDGFVKYQLLRQSRGGEGAMPLSLTGFASIAVRTQKWRDGIDHPLGDRVAYTYQLSAARKFKDWLSVQLSPTLVHRNLVERAANPNDVYALAGGVSVHVTRMLSINAEYMQNLNPATPTPGYRNAMALGVDLETGGHVFQLHFTNATGMIEKAFFAENTGSIAENDIRFGFNISRVFSFERSREGGGGKPAWPRNPKGAQPDADDEPSDD